MTVNMDSLTCFLQSDLAGAATNLAAVFIIAATIFWLDLLLALTTLNAVPVAALVAMIYRCPSTSAYVQARLEIGKINGILQGKVSGLCVVQPHGRQEPEGVRLRASSEHFHVAHV